MRKVAIFWMFLASLFMGCTTKVEVKGPWVKKIDSEALSTVIINFATKMKIDKHLELEDSYAAYDDYITKLCLSFSSQRTLTVYDARLLIVELVEDLLYRLNNNEIVSWELNHYPITANDLDVKINFESFYGRYIDELYVGLAWLQCGCVHFYAFDRKDAFLNGTDWDHHRFEPYSKSKELALIKKQADIPYIEHIEPPDPPKHRRPSSYFPERYISPYVY